MKIFGFLLPLFILVNAQASRRSADDDLTLRLAETRKEQIKSIDYDLSLELAKNAPVFTGKVIIKMELARTDLPLSFDSMVKEITSVRVNGKNLKNYPERKGSFDIPSKLLKSQTEIEIDYVSNFSQASGGLIRAEDPSDGSEYVYTDLAPYYAHHVFPCIDQPDLKARFTLTATVPSEWKVIQNELEAKKIILGDKTKTVFKQTPPLSTYLFFFGAGPFHEWSDSFNGLPLKLYARKSLKEFVDADQIFATTKAGLKFYNKYFDYRYPFSKYGQIFVPDFAWNGMENPGAITLNERHIFRGPVPTSVLLRRDSLILHEMAHMWFGDLVTMKWWNDLWLNESFATYLASIALERALDSEGTWLNFLNTKSWGYWQDQLVTTHPIETSVPDVRTAKANFDGITYAKGASALKQLHFFVGESGFREGLRSYFKKFAFQNTERKDFIDSIALASGKDLDHWTKKWLHSKGPNRASLEYDCENGKIKTAKLIQKENVSLEFLPHRIQIAFFQRQNQKLNEYKNLNITYSSRETQVKEMHGLTCPDFILPNDDDQDYVLFGLDEASFKNAGYALSSLAKPLSRHLVWETLHQMLREGDISAKEYFKLAFDGLRSEGDDLLIGLLLGKKGSLKNNYQLYLDQETKKELAPEFEELLWKRISLAKRGSSSQMAFFDFFITVVSTSHGLDRIFDLIGSGNPPQGIVLDQDRRWSIILSLSAGGHHKALELIESELKKDNSTNGKRMALSAKAAWPELKSKRLIWKTLIKPAGYSFSDLNEAAQYFHSASYPQLSWPFANDYFHQLTTTDWRTKDDQVDLYFKRLFPLSICDSHLYSLSLKSLKQARQLTSIAKRSWLEAQDELSRCLKVRGKK
jgi:aminopeptidase N